MMQRLVLDTAANQLYRGPWTGGVVGYKSWKQKVVIFRQTAADFQQKTLRVLQSSVLPLNSIKLFDFQP